MKAKEKKVKRKVGKKPDGSWDTTDLYRNSDKYPFDVEYVKYYNSVEGRDQIMFLYIDKKTKKIIKHRILR